MGGGGVGSFVGACVSSVVRKVYVDFAFRKFFCVLYVCVVCADRWRGRKGWSAVCVVNLLISVGCFLSLVK